MKTPAKARKKTIARTLAISESGEFAGLLSALRVFSVLKGASRLSTQMFQRFLNVIERPQNSRGVAGPQRQLHLSKHQIDLD